MQHSPSGGSHFTFSWEGKNVDPITIATDGGRTAKTVVTLQFLGYLLRDCPRAFKDCEKQLRNDRKALLQLHKIAGAAITKGGG